MDWRTQLEVAKTKYDEIFKIDTNHDKSGNREIKHPFTDLKHVYSTSLFRPMYKGPDIREINAEDFKDSNATSNMKENTRCSIRTEEATAGVAFLESYLTDFVDKAVLLRNKALNHPPELNDSPVKYVQFLQKLKSNNKELTVNMDKFQFERLEAVVIPADSSSNSYIIEQIKRMKDSIFNRCQLLREEIAGTAVLLEFLITEVNEIINAPQGLSCKLDYIKPEWGDVHDLQKKLYASKSCRNYEVYMEVQGYPTHEQIYGFLQSPDLNGNTLVISDYSFSSGEFIANMEYLSKNDAIKGLIHHLVVHNCVNTFSSVIFGHNHSESDTEADAESQEEEHQEESLLNDYEEYELFAQCIVRFFNLQSLTLKKLGMNDDGIHALAYGLDHYYVNTLHQRHTRLVQFYIDLIKDNIEGHETGIVVDMDLAVDILMKQYRIMPPLESLNLEDNAITSVGCNSLCKVLFRRGDNTYNFDAENEEDEDEEQQASQCPINPKLLKMNPLPLLKSFSIAGNPIGNKGLYYLMKSLLNPSRKAYKSMPKWVPGVPKDYQYYYYYNGLPPLGEEDSRIDGQESASCAEEEQSQYRTLGSQSNTDSLLQARQYEKEADMNDDDMESLFAESVYDDHELPMHLHSQYNSHRLHTRNSILNVRRSSIITGDGKFAENIDEVSPGRLLTMVVFSRIRARLFSVCAFIQLLKNSRCGNNNITTLNISNCELLSPYATHAVYHVCHDNKLIHNINMSGNDIGSDVDYGATGLETDCADDIHGCHYIAEMLLHCNLYNLDLSKCNINNSGVQIIAHALKSNYSVNKLQHGNQSNSNTDETKLRTLTIQYLNLSNNYISSTGSNWIASCLGDYYMDRCKISLSLQGDERNRNNKHHSMVRIKKQVAKPEKEEISMISVEDAYVDEDDEEEGDAIQYEDENISDIEMDFDGDGNEVYRIDNEIDDDESEEENYEGNAES